MQRLTPSVIKQLNNLPGFPAIPTSNPPESDRWILGDYLDEIKVRPGVSALVDLPLVGNVAGDVRFVVALGAWYWWTGAAWLAVAGGGGPVAGASVDVPSVATIALLAGEVVRFTNGGVQKADANAPLQLEPVGFAVAAAGIGGAVTVRTAGVVDVPTARFDVAPIAGDVGQRVWLSTTAGRITLTPPSASGDVVQRVGVLATLAGGGGGAPQVLVQVGDPVLLA